MITLYAGCYWVQKRFLSNRKTGFSVQPQHLSAEYGKELTDNTVKKDSNAAKNCRKDQ